MLQSFIGSSSQYTLYVKKEAIKEALWLDLQTFTTLNPPESCWTIAMMPSYCGGRYDVNRNTAHLEALVVLWAFLIPLFLPNYFTGEHGEG